MRRVLFLLQQNEGPTMASTSTSDNVFKFPDFSRASEMSGIFGKEWFEFVGMRLREDAQLFQTIHGCRSLQDLQQAYAQFWQTAFSQYGEEAQRLLRLTQGAAEDVARTAQDRRETTIADKAA